MNTTAAQPPLDTHASESISVDAAPGDPRTGGPARNHNHRKTVRVLHVINGEHYSGAERVQDLLAARLPEYGYAVGLACVKPNRFPHERIAVDAPLYEVPMRGRFDLRPAWKLAGIIRREGYQLIHAHTPRTALIGRIAAALVRRPMVYHVHSPAARDSTSRWQTRINASLEWGSLAGVRRLIAVSESLARYMQEQGFAEDQITVVSNGVPSAGPVRSEVPPRGEWTIGTVALFRPRKGTEVLLDALARLHRQGVSARLLAVGPFETVEYETYLKSLARELGVERAVEWTGFTRDVDAHLARMDLFALPSLFGEGLPMVVLEAMAAGVPVVATRVEGVPEAIRDTVDGALAKPGDAADLCGAIREIIGGALDWSQLRASAIRRHAERFSDRSMAAGVAAVYRQILGG